MADRRNLYHLAKYAGRWIAWNRQQTKIVATGDTFEALKSAAAQNGEQSILVAHIPPRTSLFHNSCRLIHIFAVFIALSQPIGPESAASESFNRAQEEAELINDTE